MWDLITKYGVLEKVTDEYFQIDITKLLKAAEVLGYGEAGVLSLAHYAEVGLQEGLKESSTKS